MKSYFKVLIEKSGIKNFISKNSYSIILGTLIIIGLLLRLKFLAKMGSFCFDEMASITIANFDFPKILEYFAIENNPPLHFLYLHFWIKIFGDGETVVRISSLIFGLLAIPLTYLVGKEIFSKKTGLIAAIFSTISFWQIYYSVEARMYPMFLFLSLTSIYFFWKTLKENKKKFKFFYFISSFLLIYTHLFGWLVIIFQNLFFFIYRKYYKPTKSFFYKANLALIAIFSVWLIPKFLSIIHQPVLQGWYFKNQITPLNIFQVLEKNIGIISINKFLHLFVYLAIAVLIITNFILLVRQNRDARSVFCLPNTKKYLFVFLWIVIPVFLSYFANLMISKYLIFIGPATHLLIAQSIININKSKKNILLIAVIIFLILFIGILPSITRTNKLYCWDQMAEYISREEKVSDKIIIHSFVDILEFRKYYKGDAPYEGFYIFKSNDNLEKAIIKYNWNQTFKRSDFSAIDNKLNIMTKGHKRIFLIDSIIPQFDPENLVIEWFAKNNWRLIEKKVFNSRSKLYIWLWEKIE